MAVPVGKWAIQQGFKAAMGAAASVKAGNESKKRRKDQENSGNGD